MVAHITHGSASDKDGQPFRRRNYRPGIIAVIALALVTAAAWAFVLTRPVDVKEAAACNAPPSSADATTPKLGQRVSGGSLIEVLIVSPLVGFTATSPPSRL